MLLRDGKLHAYVGAAAGGFAPAPADRIAAVESLGSLVVVRINPESPLARTRRRALLPSWRRSCATLPRGPVQATSSPIPIR